jgi:hypothetical protein
MAKACGERSPSRTYANADGVINPPRTAEHGRRRGPAEVGTRPRTGYPPGVFPVRPRDLRRPGHVANNAIPVLVPQYAGQAHASPPELVAPLPRPLTIPTVMDLRTFDRPIGRQSDSAVSRQFSWMKLSMSCWFRATATQSVASSIRLESSSRVPSSFTARTVSDATLSDIL